MHRSHSRTRLIARALACAALVLGILPASPSSAIAAPGNLTFTGRGWGHGIGLSQYGAKGFAENGKLPNGTAATGPNIAAYYYPGSVAKALASSTDKTILVNLDSAANYASGGNAGYTQTSWSIRPGASGTTLTIDVGSVALSYANGPYTFTGSGTTIVVKDKNGTAVKGSPFSGTINVTPSGGSPALSMVTGASGPFDHTYVRYRGGLRMASSGGKIKLINKLTMQQYLYGVVPRESPSSWNLEALKAQAIVARSYAWTSGGEMYCTTRSQVYNGHSKLNSDGSTSLHEASSSNIAVDQTLRVYVTYNGSVIRTFFHSSSGGHTANLTDVWLSGTMQPYYTGVADPYCASPTYDPWTPVTMPALTVASKLAAKVTGEPSGAGTSVWVTGFGVNRALSGFVKTADIVWSNGAVTKGVSGDTIRSALSLPSTKFYVGGPYTRIALGDRYSTAAAISKSSYPSAGSASVAVVVNGTDEKFADALTASALGGTANGPVLLTYSGSLPAATKTELGRLKPAKVFVIGGTGSVTDAVLDGVKSAAGTTNVVRLGGLNRYEVAANVAREIAKTSPTPTKVMIASGEMWPDSAIAAVAAAISKRPLLLVSGRSMPSATADALEELKVTETAVYGGEATIANSVIAQLCALTGEAAPTKRFGVGSNRYEEAAASADWCVATFGATRSIVYVASGEVFPDSVTGGVLAARNKHPLLLTSGAAPANPTAAWLTANKSSISTVTVLGGWGSVSDGCAASLGSLAY